LEIKRFNPVWFGLARIEETLLRFMVFSVDEKGAGRGDDEE